MAVCREARISSFWLLPYMVSKDFGSLANIHFRAFTANDAVNEVRTRTGEGICEMEKLMCGGRSDSMIGEEFRTGATALANLSPMSLKLDAFLFGSGRPGFSCFGFQLPMEKFLYSIPKPLVCQNQHRKVGRWKQTKGMVTALYF